MCMMKNIAQIIRKEILMSAAFATEYLITKVPFGPMCVLIRKLSLLDVQFVADHLCPNKISSSIY
ncbi:unnamed protein product [Larinioides sclopetarius]|uniref:Uncharacterized protein n=2 Tax=Larinioides sclopetarius TaxID=280406 RepID=A0AAV2AFI2_9ARAC